MPWLQLHFNIERDFVAILEEGLLTQGALCITLSDAKDEAQFQTEVGEMPLWQHVKLSALFEENNNPQLLLDNLNTSSTFSLPPCEIEILEDKDWEREWMEHFHPMQMGENLWICPSWLPAKNPNAVNLFLDPGLAFGTGTHPTTALCLEWLDKQANLKTLQNTQVLDYGCGSGILAIGALLLGAKHVLAVDHDPQAIIATQDNAKKNNIPEEALEVLLPHQEPPIFKADIVIANILAQPLITLTEKLATFCKEESLLILSGILKEQANSVCQHYEKHFTLINMEEKKGWVRIDLSKKAE